MNSLTHYSLYLEYSILHSMIDGGNFYVEQAYSFLREDSNKFYNENHRIVYETILDMYKRNKDINQLTVYENVNRKITQKEKLRKVFDGISKGELVSDLREPCLKLIDYTVKRMLHEISTDLRNTDDSGFDALSKVSHTIHNISTSYLPTNTVDTKTIAKTALEQIKSAKAFHDKGELPGIKTGFVELDRCIGGMRPGQLIVLAARPAMGKTAFALSTALNASKDFPVVVFSLEMDKETLLARLASQYARIDLSKMLRGDITDEEVNKIEWAMDMIQQNHQIIIDDEALLTTMLLKVKIRRYINTYGVKAVFIDYLQLMKASSAQNREREIAQLTYELKMIARDYGIPIIILAQLNRDVEHRPGKLPMLADLRESGSIEQDADLVMFLYRPEYYNITEYSDKTPSFNTCQVRIAKQRNGALANVILTFVKEYTGFYNYYATNDPPDAYTQDDGLTDDVPF